VIACLKKISRPKLVVGLGNPGLTYKGTRHNAGALAVERLAKNLGFSFRINRSLKSFLATGKTGEVEVLLLLPQTFMNLSGDAVLALKRKKGIPLSHILVVCDDVALPLGSIKIKPKGSDGGHNGLASIIERLGAKDFARLRLGIGCSEKPLDLSAYVLARFHKSEERIVDAMVEQAAQAMEMWVGGTIDKCMNRFNTKKV
jgi:PTH1 family peptidyl-tRNA hydrolase